MHENLKVILWPDPRLLAMSKPVETFNEPLAQLAARMLELMRQHRGVGLAAPQVGLNLRLFVMNPDGAPGNDRVYVNPVLTLGEGEVEGEEGCLSLPGINTKVWRADEVTLAAQDLQGQPIALTDRGYVTRIWQHETDHLNGKLITDRMGPLAKIAARRTLKELRAKYETAGARKPG